MKNNIIRIFILLLISICLITSVNFAAETELTDTEWMEIKKVFNEANATTSMSINTNLLTAQYEDAKKIDLDKILYSPLSTELKKVSVELDEAKEVYEENKDYFDSELDEENYENWGWEKFTKEDANKYIINKFGISIDDVEDSDFGKKGSVVIYSKKYDSYYIGKKDALNIQIKLVSGTVNNNVYTVNYEIENDSTMEKYKYGTVTLKKVEDGYIIVSNKYSNTNSNETTPSDSKKITAILNDSKNIGFINFEYEENAKVNLSFISKAHAITEEKIDDSEREEIVKILGCEKYADIAKYKKDKVEKELKDRLAVNIELNMDLEYIEKYDAYYRVLGTGVERIFMNVECTSVEQDDNKNYVVKYKQNDYKGTVVLKEVDGKYLFISNDIDNIEELGSKENEKTENKEDDTVANEKLPDTGLKMGIALFIVVAICGTVAYFKYNKLKNI